MDDTTTGDSGCGDSGGDTPVARRSLLGSLAVVGLTGCLGRGDDANDVSGKGGGFQTIPEQTSTPESPVDDGQGSTTTTIDQSVDDPMATPTPVDEQTSTPDETAAPTPKQVSGHGWPDVDDPYYSTLQDELAGVGLPPGAFVYARNEADTIDKFEIWSEAAEESQVDVADDQPFSSARRVDVTENTENPWDVTMLGRANTQAVENGHVLLGIVYLRAADSSAKDPTVRFVAKDENNQATNMVAASSSVVPPAEWTRYYVPMKWEYDSKPGTWWWELFHGFGKQTTDVGGLALVDFDGKVSVDDLPSGPGDGSS